MKEKKMFHSLADKIKMKKILRKQEMGEDITIKDQTNTQQ